ncbi:hypothetical protein LJC19_06435 [Oxalobacter sp. OttesenSCG-928-P03]|nr:hypothetical protein [Oxalobacter sp. OttesenSCG-928-P03]
MKKNHMELEIEIAVFRETLESYIRPLTYQAKLSGPFTDAVIPLQEVTYDTPHRLKIFLSKHTRIYFLLQRRLPFGSEEKELFSDIIERLRGEILQRGVPDYAFAMEVTESVAASFMDSQNANLIFRLIQLYKKWAISSLEEGHFSHTTGIYLGRLTKKSVNLFKMAEEKAVRAMGSSSGTLLAIDKNADIIGIETLSPTTGGLQKLHDVFAPVSVGDVALWTGPRGKIAIMLTEKGEILLFKNRQLIFAWYFSQWQYFPHRLLVEEIFEKHNSQEEMEVRKAAYLTALDIAFSGKKASIGILTHPYRKNKRLERIYQTSAQKSNRNKWNLISSIVKEKKFQNLSRKVRAELCFMSGALILDTTGELFVGLKDNAHSHGVSELNNEMDVGIKVNGIGILEIYKSSDIPLAFA